MKISLRKQKGKLKESLYLDTYYNGKRHYEFLKLFLYTKPSTATEREHNKSTEQLAESIRAKRQLEMQNNEHGFISSAKRNADFLEYFKSLTNARIKSGINLDCWQSVSKHLEGYLKNKVIRISNIDDRFLNGFKEYLLSKVSSNSAHTYFNKVKHALHQAIRDRIVNNVPGLYEVESPKHTEPHKEYLTEEEVKRLAQTECLYPVLKTAFLFSVLTGLRWSDCQKMTWKELHYSETHGWSIFFGQQKTLQREYLNISPQARNLLGEQKESNDRVFKGLKYSAWHNLELKRWAMKAGITKNITFHCARHTHATLLLTYGTDIYTVSKLLGHKDVRTTQIYAKIIDQKRILAVNSLPQINI